jgi:CheY-like chemotaxis protein
VFLKHKKSELIWPAHQIFITLHPEINNILSRDEKANREKTTVVAEMIRRIRTPLNAIIGFDTFALKNDAIDSRTRKYLEEIAQSSNELLEAINDVHDVIRPESENETPKDEVKPEDAAEEKIVRKEDLYVLVVDDDPIEAKYAGAVIKEAGIRADFCTSGQEALHMIEKQYNKKQPYNLVLMDWNMPGMNGQETTAEIRKLYGKDITVAVLTAYDWDDIQEEAQVVGVENYIQKPLLVSNVSEKIERIGIHSISEENEEKPTANLSGRRILLAEDVDLNAGILVDSLEMENIKVDHAINGRVAVDLFEKSTEGIYAAILMDVRMPVMDGIEAARVIRSMDRADAKRIPIIALTAKTFEDDIQRSMQSGMNAHLSKPIEIDELVRVLGEQVYEAERL